MAISAAQFNKFSAFILIFLLSIIGTQAQDLTKVDPVLLENSENQQACFIVFQPVDVSEAYSINGKENKGQFVCELLQREAIQAQREVRSYLEIDHIPYRSYYLVNAIFTNLNSPQIRDLSSFDEVKAIIANGSLERESVEEELALRSPELTWGLTMIGADKVWELGYRGQGAVVGDEDTGVKWDIPAIEKSYRGNISGQVDHNYHWHDAIHEINPMHNDSIIAPENNPCGLDSRVPCDDHGHGTHTVGTISGEDGDIKIGVAPESKWIACRCMERGYGTLQTYVECFEWFLAPTDLDGIEPKPELAPDVINNSWSCPEIEGCNPSNFDVMERAVDNLKAAGILVVVSAGNSGSKCSTVNTPAAIFENSFTVGATHRGDTITGFSSRGPVLVDSSYRIKPNVAAPGHSVKSQLPDSTYAHWNGTSMAGPHVSGLIALIISANPELRGEVDMIEDIIESTAVPKTLFGEGCDADSMAVPNNIYGYGRINALAAVQKALSLVSTSSTTTTLSDISYTSPFSRSLQVSWTDREQFTQAEIYNLAGERVFSADVAKQTGLNWDTANLPTGMYILKLSSSKTERSLKVVKQ